ncbi:MAG: MTH1187 family thiamine-binding protein [Bacteroidales bacterium]
MTVVQNPKQIPNFNFHNFGCPRLHKISKIKTQNTEPETRKHETQNTKPKTRNTKHETRNTKPETRNTKPETRNTKHETQNPKPETQNTEHETRNTKLGTRNTKPKTQNPSIMSVLVNFAMFPTDKGASVSPYVSRILKMLKDSNVNYKLSAMGTIFETNSMGEALEVLEKAYAQLADDCDRVYSVVNFDIQKNKPMGRLTSKIQSIEDKIGTVNK